MRGLAQQTIGSAKLRFGSEVRVRPIEKLPFEWIYG
jgi:hypothetical protein